MKFYTNNYSDLLTKKQFEEKYLNRDTIFNVLFDGYFQNEFIAVCNNLSESSTIKRVLIYFVNQLQENKELFSKYLAYWDIKEKEIDNEKIIEELKES